MDKSDLPEEQPLKPENKSNEAKPNTTWKEKLINIKNNVTLEPILASYVVPGVLARLAMQNLNLDKACRVNLGYGDQVCDALIAKEGDRYHEEEIQVQKLIASMEVWKNVLLTAIPSFLILFIGAWSDRTGKRKACVLIPVVGDFIMCLSNILNTYFFYEMPVQVTMFMEAFFPAVTGGWITTYMGVFSYISDVSSEESRTFRVGIANLCLTAGTPIGSALSGVLLKHLGYYGVFTLSGLLYFFSIVYGYFYIQDPQRPGNKENVEKTGMWNFLKTFFDVKHVRDTFQVTFKKGPNRRRTKAILVFTAIAFIYGPSYGEFTVRYLFTRYRFQWDAVKYSFFNTFYVCVHALGALISISFFSRMLKWDDSVLGLISNCSHFVGAILSALAKNGYEFYLAIAVETFNASSFTALRSISSKLVTSDELGKMISLFNLMEIVTSMVSGPVYSWFYMMTLSHDAGAFYYISTALSVPAMGIFMWFFIQHRTTLKQEKGETVRMTNRNLVSSKENSLINSLDLADEKVIP
ncbi:hypothetical protein JYU34_016701 [Plutella xylostella]|uniref:Adenylate cyclase n=1 Tax=Plutella xylostella TaxID=51655 RepID=A0ABQ7Q473_PLUXY|nr:proton-coupled folate transporter isoform X1 [Plutella xylostella]KAG7299703.1 hypothetical protein JYU34_016701 [Plutella xylostella]